MIENKTEKAMMAIFVAVLISFGVVVMPEDTHYSESLNITMHCEKLSKSGLTCYPHSDTTKGKKYSTSGWMSIIEDSIPVNKYEQSNGEWVCNNEGCKDVAT